MELQDFYKELKAQVINADAERMEKDRYYNEYIINLENALLYAKRLLGIEERLNIENY